MIAPVMVVDDEAMVRKTLAQAIERSGAEVITAADGEEALAKFREMRNPLVREDERVAHLAKLRQGFFTVRGRDHFGTASLDGLRKRLAHHRLVVHHHDRRDHLACSLHVVIEMSDCSAGLARVSACRVRASKVGTSCRALKESWRRISLYLEQGQCHASLVAKMPLGRQKTPVEDSGAMRGWEKLCRPASHSPAVRQIFDQRLASGGRRGGSEAFVARCRGPRRPSSCCPSSSAGPCGYGRDRSRGATSARPPQPLPLWRRPRSAPSPSHPRRRRPSWKRARWGRTRGAAAPRRSGRRGRGSRAAR